MPEVIITALLPIITTLMLGFFAGWRQDFNAKQAAIFNKMVLRYALPMTLFAGILSMPKTQIFSSGPVVILLLLGMGGGYGITFLIARYLGRCPVNESALCALSVGAPAVPFVGISVLGHLFGSSSILLISICSLMMNIVQVPITVMLLSSTATADTENTSPHPSSFFQHIIHAFTEPIVIAPIAAILFVFCSIPLPEALKSSFMLLGKASGGVALF
ncbi:MAG: AEC family transporter, partial [Zymomonas mobilis subsp. pomaceae]